MIRLASLLLALQVAPGPDPPSGVPAVLDRLDHPLEETGPLASFDALVEWFYEHEPQAAGRQANLEDDPDETALTLYVVESDSTVWIQAPDGDMISLDATAVVQLGDDVDAELDIRATPPTSWGHGVDSGYLYLYGDWKISFWTAGLLGVGLPLLIVLIIGYLARRLRLATLRGHQLADSRRRLADSRESERLQLARDLHDGPMQDLQAIRMRLAVLQRANGPGASPPGGETMVEVQDEILRVGRELRGISEGLRPPVLGPFGLAAAVRALADRFRLVYPDINLVLDLREDGLGLSEQTRLALYRIVQEAINNAATHGKPSQIAVHFSVDAGPCLIVEDDGDGFAVPAELHSLEAEGHLGVAGMSERAESIGGTLQIKSRPGTRVSVQLPNTVYARHSEFP